MLGRIAKSLGLTILVSVSVAFFLTSFNINFWASALLVTVLQIAAWNIFQYFEQKKVAQQQADEEIKLIELLSKQSTIIPCVECKVDNVVPIRFDQDNQFECVGCKKNNAVYMNIESASVTTPLEGKLNINESGQQ